MSATEPRRGGGWNKDRPASIRLEIPFGRDLSGYAAEHDWIRCLKPLKCIPAVEIVGGRDGVHAKACNLRMCERSSPKVHGTTVLQAEIGAAKRRTVARVKNDHHHPPIRSSHPAVGL
jgi:hypothetical protein